MGRVPSGNFAPTMPSASALRSTSSAVPPGASNRFEIVFWNGASWRRAVGSHACVCPDGFKTSTRVVTSKVRQPPRPASSANANFDFGSARVAETTPLSRRKSRRFMSQPPSSSFFNASDPLPQRG
jgi:hypothetical protein